MRPLPLPFLPFTPSSSSRSASNSSCCVFSLSTTSFSQSRISPFAFSRGSILREGEEGRVWVQVCHFKG
jgi:hypothetical protein